MSYRKPWLSIDEQLALLARRGLIVDDRAAATACLERIGYYRLSGYMYAFRQRSEPCCIYPKSLKKIDVERIVLDEFKPGSRLKDCVDLYVFDKKLRLLLLDALERIEVAIRVDVAHLLGRRNAFAYLSTQEFHSSFSEEICNRKGVTKHHDWVRKQADLINRSKEEYIIYNKGKTGLPLPIWIACEVWDFGTLSTIFGGMKEDDQDEISKKYGISNGRIFASWLQSLNYVRNICAHHSRLWNRNIERTPKLPTDKEIPWVSTFLADGHARTRSFLQVMMLSHMVRQLNPNSSWSGRMKFLLLSFPDLTHVGLNLAGMGAPDEWKDLLS